MGNKLSYSAISTYNTCGRKYKLSYIDKLREKKKNSALFFGSAIDAAIGVHLQTRDLQKAKETFDKEWTYVSLNKLRNVYLPSCLNVNYTSRDTDLQILTREDIRFIKAKEDEGISEQEIKILYAWHSLRRKGYLMLEAHEREILPRIKETINIQKKITLDNGIEGDTLSGYVDAIVKWDNNDYPTLFDYKTASTRYKADSISNGNQLTIYSHATGIPNVGYIVFDKNIRKTVHKTCETCAATTIDRSKTCSALIDGKRCGGKYNEEIIPTANIQVLIEDISPKNEEDVLQNVQDVNLKIRAKEFEPNFEACRQPWGLCSFYKICHENDYSDVEES